MTQSIVPFVLENNWEQGSSSSTPVMQSYVFDGEIAPEAQAYYTGLMTTLQTSFSNMQAEYNQFHNPFSPGDANVQNFLSALNALNAWAGLIQVNSTTGQQEVPSFNVVMTNGIKGPNPSNGANTAFDPTASLDTAHDAYAPSSFNVLPSMSVSSFNIKIPNPSSPGSTVTANGVTSTMSAYMAQALEQINRVLKAASGGAFIPDSFPSYSNASAPSGFLNAITALVQTVPGSTALDPTVYQLPTLITSALSASKQAQIINNASTQSESIQQAVAVDYISDGNNLIYNTMNNLNSAINVNQQALQFLNALQDLMNQKSPQQFALDFSALSNLSIGPSDTQYGTFESQSFNQQLGTIAKFTGNDASTVADANTLLQQAFASISDLSDPGAVPSSAYSYMQQTLVNNISQLKTSLTNSGASAASGLVAALSQVSTDISGEPNIASWVQDFSSTGTTSGDNQQNLNNAIAAAQSFNQTEQANLQQALFVYQQFYQSASGLMTQINQILQDAASNINK